MMRFLLPVLLLSLTGCSYLFPNESLDYLETAESPETRMPEGISLQETPRYPVPAASASAGSLPEKFIAPTPDRLVETDEDDERVTSLSEYQSYDTNPRLEKDGSGTEILRLSTPFAVSWARVTEVISESDILLSDLNRSIGTYYVDLPNPEAVEDTRSWWKKLWSAPPEPVATFLLKMNRAGDGVYLSLLKDPETLADEDLTHRVLSELKQQLSR